MFETYRFTKALLGLSIVAFLFMPKIHELRGQTKMDRTKPKNALPVSTPITTETSGKMGMVAAKSVMRVICKATNMGGTGFLHKSGFVITAAHVVSNCNTEDLYLLMPSGKKINVAYIKKDPHYDLAIIKPAEDIKVPTLQISTNTTVEVGSQVTTWGFPSGYNALTPLLTVGYLSGIDRLPTESGLSPWRWVVNAAFNGGNSGGPILDLEDGSVIGVVSSKLAPIPPLIESALEALSNQKSGFMYTKTLPNGKKVNVSEGQIIGEVLKYLRSQNQLVLGHVVTSNDLIQFLKSNGIEP